MHRMTIHDNDHLATLAAKEIFQAFTNAFLDSVARCRRDTRSPPVGASRHIADRLALPAGRNHRFSAIAPPSALHRLTRADGNLIEPENLRALALHLAFAIGIALVPPRLDRLRVAFVGATHQFFAALRAGGLTAAQPT